jgi:signal transduction histidine kinase
MTTRSELMSRRSSAPEDQERKPAVRQALVRFLLGSALALVILAAGTVYVGGRIAEDQALSEARNVAKLLAQRVAAPLVTEAFREGNPQAKNRLESAMRERLRDGSITHIKLWDPDGTVLWSDESNMIGHTYPIDPEDRKLFGTTNATADVSPLNKLENANERASGELLEVYAGARDDSGHPIMFEAYLPLDTLHRQEVAIITGVLPVGIGGLLLFAIFVLPMAIRLSRRVERHEAERSKMMRHALVASELERRRLAQELHDGVIQDLAGITFALPTVAASLPDDEDGDEARETVDSVTELVQKDATALRSMLVELYPPDLGGKGFAMAVRDIARSASEQGVAVKVDVDPDLVVPLDVATLAYRVIREGLRNVVKHARATAAEVRMRVDSGRLDVVVADDGQGVDPSTTAERGHFGLQLLRDTVSDLGGTLRLGANEPQGAVLNVSIPMDLIPS